jgi:hypothetical protein
MAPLCQSLKGLSIFYEVIECVNFGYGISSKIPEVFGKVKMKILTHLPFYKT